MSKKLFFSFALASLLAFSFTSCLKDGDLEALKHPIHLTGTFNPNLGLPVGSAEFTIGDMLGMFQRSTALLEIDSNDVLTIAFDTTFDNHFDINKKGLHKGAAKAAGDTLTLFNQVCQGYVDINLFDNIQGIPSEDDLQITGLVISLNSLVHANCDVTTAARMQQFNTTATIDSIHLRYMDHNNQWHEFQLSDSAYVLPADELTSPTSDGCLVNLLDNSDISSILNSRPRKLEYLLRLKFDAPASALFGSDPNDFDAFMTDSLKINSIDLHSNASVRFPLNLYLRNLTYGLDIAVDMQSLSEQIDKYNASLEESHLYLEMLNGIPLGFNLGVEFQDANNNTLCTITDAASTIEGAQTTLNTATGTYFASSATQGLIDIKLDQQTVSILNQAKYIHVNAAIHTSDQNNPAKPCVSIRSCDYLGANAYLQVHPTITIDIPILNNSNNE